MPRLLCIMGSGETAPTMTAVHADLMERVGSPPADAVLLDTPFGFQENADEIVLRVQAYFARSVGRPLALASLRDALTADPLAAERAVEAVRGAAYVFSGPGSPSYALRHWSASRIPTTLRERLRGGASFCVAFSSAAATTLGRVALPVYEIYKVGEPSRWLDGLDLMAEAGLDVAVIPHYDNAEGGTHDTRYCYMGERRLRLLEALLPPTTTVLGVDEHTACILDLDAGTTAVRGRGALVTRRGGVERRVAAGETVPTASLAELGGPARPASPLARAVEAAPGGRPVAAADDHNPVTAGVAERRAGFDAAMQTGDVDAMLTALLSLDEHLVAWASETPGTDALDRGRSELRGMVVRLGQLARTGTRDPAELVGPYVELALRLRDQARATRRFADADAIRDTLTALGVEVRDGPEGTAWVLGATR